MEEPPRAHPAIQTRSSRANKLLHSLSQFKGIIRLPGRKTKDDRDLQHHPYPSQAHSMGNHAGTKPFMSQPHLGLKRNSKNGQHDSQTSKLSGSSERSWLHDEGAPQKRSPLIPEQQLRSSAQLDLPINPSSPPPPQSMPTQSSQVIGSGDYDTGKSTSHGFPGAMQSNTISASPVSASRPSTSPIIPSAQPASKKSANPPPSTSSAFPKRPSTANSVQSTATTKSSNKISPLLTLRRSLSQLRLHSSTTKQPDVTTPTPALPTPAPTNSSSTSPHSHPTSQSPTSPSTPTATTATTAIATTTTSITTSATTTTTTTPATNIKQSLPHPLAHHPAIPMSGALAPMSIVPKPIPSGVQRQNLGQQPPKLSLPLNHRISLTVGVGGGGSSARLSPTVISRPPPLPLLNLPTLTPRPGDPSLSAAGNTSASHGAGGAGSGGTPGKGLRSGSFMGGGGGGGGGGDKKKKKEGKARLKSMPALPLQGTARGAGGHEEVDDMEEEDEEEEEEEEEEEDLDDEDDEDSSRRMRNSKKPFGRLEPKSNGGATTTTFDSSASNVQGRLNRRISRDRTPSTSSSYHSAHDEFSPEVSGVVLLKQPTPPRGFTPQSQNQNQTQTRTQAQTQSFGLSPSSQQASSPYSHAQDYRQKQRIDYLPEVDTSGLDISFLSRSPPSSPADIKGKGKARDFGVPTIITPTTSAAASASAATSGVGRDWDSPSKTPTATNNALFRNFISPQTLHSQSPTAVGPGSAVDYFNLRATPAAQSPPSTYSHSRLHQQHPVVGLGHNNTPSSSFTPTSQIRASGGDYFAMRSPMLTSGMPTPKRSSTALLSPKGSGGGQGVYGIGMVYKRASQSLVDLHTIETKEKRRMLEEEARVEEERELVQLREQEKEREKGEKGRKERSKSREAKTRSRIEDEKLKEDDEERDKFATPTKGPPSPLITSPVSPYDSGAVATATTGVKKQKRLSTASHYLRRRRSMPMFDETSEPPPYPTFAPHHPKYKVMPREDEGREKLPSYSNSVYLRAIMPRKMEFSEPGVQARDRKWRRVLCVLDGTIFKVYKCPSGHAGVGVLGEWWEKQVGAGDVSLQPSHEGAVSTIQIETRESRRLAEEQRDLERQIQRITKMEGGGGEGMDGAGETTLAVPATLAPPPVVMEQQANDRGSPTPVASSSSKSRFAQFLKPGKTHARSKSDHPFQERMMRSPSPRPSLNISRESGASTPVSGRSHSPFGPSMRTQQSPGSTSSQSMLISGSGQTSSTSHSPLQGNGTLYSATSLQQQQQQALQVMYTNREREFVPDPDPADLLRVYTMQYAESGLGNDYAKRRNVIRLRLEGEQFLLQARDVTGVIEWIEALQAATNIALDIDERPMPRGPLFPRRRRRRRAQVASTNEEGQ